MCIEMLHIISNTLPRIEWQALLCPSSLPFFRAKQTKSHSVTSHFVTRWRTVNPKLCSSLIVNTYNRNPILITMFFFIILDGLFEIIAMVGPSNACHGGNYGAGSTKIPPNFGTLRLEIFLGQWESNASIIPHVGMWDVWPLSSHPCTIVILNSSFIIIIIIISPISTSTTYLQPNQSFQATQKT